mmetsp:Transcript_63093/g.186413  ORF Transcript_63093/g.186413 Transcript_63093/m.186413 type:complete len:606 (-) Transcript_63093:604-2421(-)
MTLVNVLILRSLKLSLQAPYLILLPGAPSLALRLGVLVLLNPKSGGLVVPRGGIRALHGVDLLLQHVQFLPLRFDPLHQSQQLNVPLYRLLVPLLIVHLLVESGQLRLHRFQFLLPLVLPVGRLGQLPRHLLELTMLVRFDVPVDLVRQVVQLVNVCLEAVEALVEAVLLRLGARTHPLAVGLLRADLLLDGDDLLRQLLLLLLTLDNDLVQLGPLHGRLLLLLVPLLLLPRHTLGLGGLGRHPTDPIVDARELPIQSSDGLLQRILLVVPRLYLPLDRIEIPSVRAGSGDGQFLLLRRYLRLLVEHALRFVPEACGDIEDGPEFGRLLPQFRRPFGRDGEVGFETVERTLPVGDGTFHRLDLVYGALVFEVVGHAVLDVRVPPLVVRLGRAVLDGVLLTREDDLGRLRVGQVLHAVGEHLDLRFFHTPLTARTNETAYLAVLVSFARHFLQLLQHGPHNVRGDGRTELLTPRRKILEQILRIHILTQRNVVLVRDHPHPVLERPHGPNDLLDPLHGAVVGVQRLRPPLPSVQQSSIVIDQRPLLRCTPLGRLDLLLDATQLVTPIGVLVPHLVDESLHLLDDAIHAVRVAPEPPRVRLQIVLLQ